MRLEHLQTADDRVAVYQEGARLRIVWRDPATGQRRQVRRSDPDAAADAVREIVGLLDGHVDPASANGHRRVADLVKWYLDPASRTTLWSPEYVARQTSITRTWVLPSLGRKRCSELTHHDLRAVVQAARQAGRAEETVQGIASTLTGMVRVAKDAGFIDVDSGIAADVYRRQGARAAGESVRWINPRTLPSPERIDEIAAYMGGRWEPWLRLQTLVAAYTGLRYGEQAALTADSVNLSAQSIDVTVAYASKSKQMTPPKWNRERTTFIPAPLLRLFEERLAEIGPRDLVFPAASGEPRTGTSFHATRFGPARRDLGWPKRNDNPQRWAWTWHSLRHTFCTWALAPPPDGLGLEVADVAYFAGHHSPEFTYSRYVGRRDGALERASAASSRHVSVSS